MGLGDANSPLVYPGDEGAVNHGTGALFRRGALSPLLFGREVLGTEKPPRGPFFRRSFGGQGKDESHTTWRGRWHTASRVSEVGSGQSAVPGMCPRHESSGASLDGSPTPRSPAMSSRATRDGLRGLAGEEHRAGSRSDG